MCTTPAKVGRLASTLLNGTSVLRNEDPPPPPPSRSSLRGRTKVAKVGPLRARVKSAKVPPTPLTSSAPGADLRSFDEVRPRPLRGPRTSSFDEISTWGCVQGPNRLEPSMFRTPSANRVLRKARTTPRFAPIRGGVIWREFRRLSACFGVASPFYRHPQSALDVTRLPTAQFRMSSTCINICVPTSVGSRPSATSLRGDGKVGPSGSSPGGRVRGAAGE
jgi:hypothetical protein